MKVAKQGDREAVEKMDTRQRRSGTPAEPVGPVGCRVQASSSRTEPPDGLDGWTEACSPRGPIRWTSRADPYKWARLGCSARPRPCMPPGLPLPPAQARRRHGPSTAAAPQRAINGPATAAPRHRDGGPGQDRPDGPPPPEHHNLADVCRLANACRATRPGHVHARVASVRSSAEQPPVNAASRHRPGAGGAVRGRREALVFSEGVYSPLPMR